MASRHDTNRPKPLDKVWVYNDGQPWNGYVQWINWRSIEHDVHVRCLDTGRVEKFPLSDFRGNYGNHDQWYLTKSGWECHLQNIRSGAWRSDQGE